MTITVKLPDSVSLIGTLTEQASLSGALSKPATLIGTLSKPASLIGTISKPGDLIGTLSKQISLSGTLSEAEGYEEYKGTYIFTPTAEPQTIGTNDRLMIDDIVIDKIPFAAVKNVANGMTVTIA